MLFSSSSYLGINDARDRDTAKCISLIAADRQGDKREMKPRDIDDDQRFVV